MNTAEYKRQIVSMVEHHIKEGDIDHLIGDMPLADKYGCPKPVRKAGWTLIGDHFSKSDSHHEAIIAFNQARKAALRDLKVLSKIFDSLGAFVAQYREHFSSEDLALLAEALERILDFCKVQGSGDTNVVRTGRWLLNDIKGLQSQVPSKRETPASFKCQQIFDALYSNMTIEEVYAEWARLAAPLVREALEKKDEKKKATKKRKKTKTKKLKKKKNRS